MKSVAPEVGRLPDVDQRRLAETTFDRNVVVIAGAGTGKTTLLANRLIHALVRDPDPISITQIVALTFTNKAATEMKGRLRERLLALTRNDEQESDGGAVSLPELRERYRLSSEEIAGRARAALGDLEKAQIGTLHSFAAHVLRLHPLESGIDPDFREDDETEFVEYFDEHWQQWLDRELGAAGQAHDRWRRVLRMVNLEALRTLALGLSNDLVPLAQLVEQVADSSLPPALRRWVQVKRDRAAFLLARYERPNRRKAESVLAATERLLTVLLEKGMEAVSTLESETAEWFAKDLGQAPAGWDDEDFAECQSFRRIGRGILSTDRRLLEDVVRLLVPFLDAVRRGFVREGAIRFDGLLAQASALLRDQATIRERIKREYRAILIDEFQDTDPSQYEIVLYLAERPGRTSTDWRDIELAAGKLFIVGDPKQSIYAFRRADIEAFDQVVNKVRDSGGLLCTLMTNFRSDASVLEAVNGCFDRLLRQKDNVQPANVALRPRPGRQSPLKEPGVLLRLVTPDEDGAEFDAAAATRAEAESLAVYVKGLLGTEVLTDRQGQPTPLQPGHVALLFRKLTQAQEYLDALRRHKIDYVTDGEKHFYRRQEVIDLVNVVRVIENPLDAIAMTGVLRSALGGLTDREVLELRRLGSYDYRQPGVPADWPNAKADSVRELYGRLAELHRQVAARPLPCVFDALFARLPLLELAAASLHGEQAVANLLKVREMAVTSAPRPHLTLSRFVDMMIDRLAEQPEEGEGALAEESLAAVRVLTIHKAKGLEFPIVVLPGLHHGSTTGRDDRPVFHDWATGVAGVALGDSKSLGAVLIGEKTRECEEAERRRLFYVGMTRARERLILSGAVVRRSSRTFLGLIETLIDEEHLGSPERDEVDIGPVRLRQVVVTAPERTARTRREGPTVLAPAPDCRDAIRRWEDRERRWTDVRQRPEQLIASRLVEQGVPSRRRRTKRVDADQARLIGTAVHRVLEHWDFLLAPDGLCQRVPGVVRAILAGQPAADEAMIVKDVEEILKHFVTTDAYARLQRAEIIGREVPLLMPWSPRSSQPSLFNQDDAVMEGVIDLLYRLDRVLWIADYKTEWVEEAELDEHINRHRLQADVYREAVARCCPTDRIRFQLIFLRTGRMIEL